eukprot:4989648-Prymnesium_polylepis.1
MARTVTWSRGHMVGLLPTASVALEEAIEPALECSLPPVGSGGGGGGSEMELNAFGWRLRKRPTI